MNEFVIEGTKALGIAPLYEQFNDLLMDGEDWRLGPSLDALDDALYGGFGALRGAGRVRFVWRDHALSREALGCECTEAWLRAKLTPGSGFDHQGIRAQLDALRATGHPTYFELVLEVFAGHPDVELILA